jgi:hypothetical protein
MKFEIDTSDLERLRRSFEVFSDRRFNAGLASALTAVAQGVRDDQQREMRDVFDRPTRFALGQVYVRRATAAQLVAEVGVSDSPYTVGFLKPNIFGGTRRHKRFEKLLIGAGAMPAGMYAVPGRFAKLDAFGNISGGWVRQVLSQLRIEPTQGATSALPRVSSKDRRLVANARRGSGFVGPISRTAVKDAQGRLRRVETAYRRAGGQFIALPNGRGKLRPGIYQVPATASGRRVPRPALIFVGSASYEAQRFDFFDVAQRGVAQRLGPAIQASMADQMRRWAAKYRGGTA